jgi:hypothetical protein
VFELAASHPHLHSQINGLVWFLNQEQRIGERQWKNLDLLVLA